MGKLEGMKRLGRHRDSWGDNIKIDLQDLGLEHGLNLKGLGQGHVVSSCELGNEHLCSIKCKEFLIYLKKWYAETRRSSVGLYLCIEKVHFLMS